MNRSGTEEEKEVGKNTKRESDEERGRATKEREGSMI